MISGSVKLEHQSHYAHHGLLNIYPTVFIIARYYYPHGSESRYLGKALDLMYCTICTCLHYARGRVRRTMII
jgi:hypothetical protein